MFAYCVLDSRFEMLCCLVPFFASDNMWYLQSSFLTKKYESETCDDLKTYMSYFYTLYFLYLQVSQFKFFFCYEICRYIWWIRLIRQDVSRRRNSWYLLLCDIGPTHLVMLDVKPRCQKDLLEVASLYFRPWSSISKIDFLDQTF